MIEFLSPDGDSEEFRPAAPTNFIDMSAIARNRLQQMGGDIGRIIAVFDQAVGPQLAQVAVPVSLKRGVLRVQCSSASWAQSLTFLEVELLTKLRAACPGVELRTIRTAVGNAPAAQAQRAPATQTAPPRVSQAPIDEPTDAALRAAAAAITDPQLRERVLAAARSSTRRSRESR